MLVENVCVKIHEIISFWPPTTLPKMTKNLCVIALFSQLCTRNWREKIHFSSHFAMTSIKTKRVVIYFITICRRNRYIYSIVIQRYLETKRALLHLHYKASSLPINVCIWATAYLPLPQPNWKVNWWHVRVNVGSGEEWVHSCWNANIDSRLHNHAMLLREKSTIKQVK